MFVFLAAEPAAVFSDSYHMHGLPLTHLQAIFVWCQHCSLALFSSAVLVVQNSQLVAQSALTMNTYVLQGSYTHTTGCLPTWAIFESQTAAWTTLTWRCADLHHCRLQVSMVLALIVQREQFVVQLLAIHIACCSACFTHVCACTVA